LISDTYIVAQLLSVRRFATWADKRPLSSSIGHPIWGYSLLLVIAPRTTPCCLISFHPSVVKA